MNNAAPSGAPEGTPLEGCCFVRWLLALLPLPVDAGSTLPQCLKFSVRRSRHLEPFTDELGFPPFEWGPHDAYQGELCFAPSPGIGYSIREGCFYVDVFHCVGTQVIIGFDIQYQNSDDVGLGNGYSARPIGRYYLEGYLEGTPKEGPEGIPEPPLRWS